MKKITLIATMMFIVTVLFAQAPQAFKYQAIARDNAGDILANQVVSFRMTILQGALPGTPVYSETHSGATNEFGLITLEIGRGTPVSGNFETINWSITPCFLKTELDPAGGSAYVEMGTSELLSTPYALYAKTAETSGTTYTAGSGINIVGTVISNTAENATHTGDATGATALTVEKIQGQEISTTAPHPVRCCNGMALNGRLPPYQHHYLTGCLPVMQARLMALILLAPPIMYLST